MRRTVRLGLRAVVLLFVGTFVVLIGAQYVHIIERNIAYARRLHDVEADITRLEAQRRAQQRDIARLSDPQGAIPEIHDRLHVVGDHEAIIYLKHHDRPATPP